MVIKAKMFWDDEKVVEVCSDLLQRGKVILSTTDTVLGLQAKVSDEGIISLNDLKKRSNIDKPYIILVASIDDALTLIDPLESSIGIILMRACWPGPLTIIAKAAFSAPTYAVSPQGTIALRLPSHAGLQRLLMVTGPLFSTSANISGHPIPTKTTDVEDEIAEGVSHVVLDSGTIAESPLYISSTIIDCADKKAVLVRAGAYPVSEIQEALGKEKLLFEQPLP